MYQTVVTIDGHTYDIVIQHMGEEISAQVLSVDNIPLEAEQVNVFAPQRDQATGVNWMIINGRSYELIFDRELRWVQTYRGRHTINVRDRNTSVTRPPSGDGRVKAPIPGLIARLLIEPDQEVELGTPLLILEAMKMENEISAPRGGRITQINVQPGQTVTLNEVLIEIE
ncbi:MAG: acetyl-CoA carboxylase biotin carboxyl carrier protein subunit [Caldilineaceae bacterium]|nr:acetyl-CoA carboxylase biotin carboxyl carrier protein subunit [Caldilineaceae bacterium]